MSKKKPAGEQQVVGFVGVGLDNADGEERVSRSEHFLLVGGSQQTHERMQDIAIRFDESLSRRGKPLHETPVAEVIDLFRRASDP